MVNPCLGCSLAKREARMRNHYIVSGCEYSRRVLHLITSRGMSMRAARVVVDAAMYGIGCIEGEVRAKIEAGKKDK